MSHTLHPLRLQRLQRSELFRHPDVSEPRDKSPEDPRETYASDRSLSYFGLGGNIGCMINGAGLAMAAMDMTELAGGEPANFLDIGGGARPERVLKAFRTVLIDEGVKVVLVNTFAGINRCDRVAEGVVKACGQADIKGPVVVRPAGTNVEQGRKIIAQPGLPIITADSARNSVAAAGAISSNVYPLCDSEIAAN